MMDLCPICQKPVAECKGYPLMRERFAAGRDVAHWRRIHDQLNGLIPTEPVQTVSAEDRSLQAYIARHGCGGCGH